MAKMLGLCVATRDSLPHVTGLAKAAKGAGIEVGVFLTGDGVHLTHQPGFSELLQAARVGVCEVSYIANGYRGRAVPGLGNRDFVTQLRNAELVEKSDRYLIL